MTNSNSQNEMTSTSIGLSHGEMRTEMVAEHRFNLPNDFRTLSAMKIAIDAKMAEMQTTGAETLRSMLLQESEALGLDPMAILTGSGKKPRGRKPKSKRDE